MQRGASSHLCSDLLVEMDSRDILLWQEDTCLTAVPLVEHTVGCKIAPLVHVRSITPKVPAGHILRRFLGIHQR